MALDACGMTYRFATLNDVPWLARWNRQLVEDEGHRHTSMPADWFEARMRTWLTAGHRAVLFESGGEPVSYALFVDHPDHDDTVYLRHLFVDRNRRRQGIGRETMRILTESIWPPEKRLTVEVLDANPVARAFFESVGYRMYSIELEITAEDRGRGKA